MKAEIDKYIQEYYLKLVRIAQNKVAYYDRQVEAEAIVADAYLYVCKNPPETVEDIPRWFVNYFNIELRFDKSNTTRRYRIRSLDYNGVGVIDEHQDEEIRLDIQDSVDAFTKELDRVDQIVWECYVYKGKRRLKDLAEHFDIPVSCAYTYRRRILDKYKEFYKDNYED